MRIGIDIDGVLTDIEKWQLDYGSKYYYEKYNKKIVNPKGYDTSEVFDVSTDMENRWWFYGIKEYMKEPARRFAGEIIGKLKNEGNEIYIITARSSDLTYTDITTEEMQEEVRKWLKDNGIIYDKLIFSPEDKLEICLENKIDLMIEDRVANINQISTKIPVICYNAGYNEKCKGENIIRCYSWYDIYDKCKQYIDTKKTL
ncbi:MAG: hypothetical protein ACI4VQ_00455 [Clostridia bacterium]